MGTIKLKRRNSVFVKREWKNIVFYSCLLIIPLAQFSVFWFGVNARSLLYSFQKWDDGKYIFNGFKTYKAAITELTTLKNWSIGFKNAILLFLIGLPFPFLTLFIALFFFKAQKRGSKVAQVWKVILFVPSMIAPMVMVSIYGYIVDFGIPALYELATGKELHGLLQNQDTSFATMWIFGRWGGIAGGVFIYVNLMNSIPESVYEAARLDGVNMWQEFWKIIFPQIFNTWKMFYVMNFLSIFTNAFNLFEFYGYAAPTWMQTTGYLMFVKSVEATSADIPTLSAIGMIFTLIGAPLVFLLRYIFNRVDPMED